MNPNVIVIGAGFAGLKIARDLSRKAVDVLLIDRNNYHTFTPLLYQVATCGLDPSAVAYPVRSIFKDSPNVNFLLGTVTAIQTEQQSIQIQTMNGLRQEQYDYLVIATGSEVNYFGNQDIRKNAFCLRDLDDAIILRNHILRLLEKAVWTTDTALRDALMTFVVVGGGPTGLETAGALYELYNNVLDNNYDKHDTMCANVILLEAMDAVLSPYPEKLQASAKQQLESLGIDVRLNARVQTIASDHLTLEDGTIIKTHTVLWSAGVKANTLAHLLAIELQKGGRIPVAPTLEVRGLQHVFAAGDIAYLPQPETNDPYPQLIPVAQQQGAIVAKNIIRHLEQAELETFSYFDRGIMATIGRQRAVAWAFNRIQMSGFIAWIAWLGLHLLVLMGMRNRVQVFLNWVWNYIFYDRSVQIIVAGESAKSTTDT